MATPPRKLNLRSTAVKRIMQEAQELASADVDDDGFTAAPVEDDIFEWHCTMRGVEDSEYEGGLYHFRIVLPPSYPMSAPDIILLTPNGRFELGKKICIDGLTSFHAGSWQPAWGVRTAIVGLRSFWMQTGEALSGVGALDYSKDERKRLAKMSAQWKCPTCEVANEEILPCFAERVDKGKGKAEEEVTERTEREGAGDDKDVDDKGAPGEPMPLKEVPPFAPAPQALPAPSHISPTPIPRPAPQPSTAVARAPPRAAPALQDPGFVRIQAHQSALDPNRPVPLWLDHLIGFVCIIFGLVVCKRVGTYIMSP
ncbi:hypothetical protein B9479_006380 [Cryptococcus floricola]|uniref:UBC core domain-containing protein n=1 Tax=Cryptococcus floricola TaxID=2591691 RepID=A0A5D3AS80_9TREE|nr:hypothetical protein B9479_006380 [Cryptococcus floricola]